MYSVGNVWPNHLRAGGKHSNGNCSYSSFSSDTLLYSDLELLSTWDIKWAVKGCENLLLSREQRFALRGGRALNLPQFQSF
jgi:hypothetical protein